MDKFCEDCVHNEVCRYEAYCPSGHCNDKETIDDLRPQGKWGKWIITEIQCPTCFGYFETDCYSTEELKKCPNCGADMKGGAE